VFVVVFGVAQEPVVVDLYFTLLITVLHAQLHVLAERLTFLLGQRSHDGQHYLTL
jgi:hypothetical protein